MARAIHLFNTCERLILQRCRFCRHRSLILERSISTTIFSKPDFLFPTDLFAFGKSGREKISLERYVPGPSDMEQKIPVRPSTNLIVRHYKTIRVKFRSPVFGLTNWIKFISIQLNIFTTFIKN